MIKLEVKVFICYRLDRLTYDGTGLDLEVDNFNWIRYIEIVQSRSRLDHIVDSIIFQSGSRVQVPLLIQR